jgi:hypothetical protein
LRTGHATQRGDVFRREIGGHGAKLFSGEALCTEKGSLHPTIAQTPPFRPLADRSAPDASGMAHLPISIFQKKPLL